MKKKVCVVGGGGAGLAAAKTCLAAGLQPTILEQSDRLGGTWVYTPHTGTDSYGLPIHTSMYSGLRTNLPKEVMGFPDFPIPEQEKSFIPSQDILNFLEDYAQHFDLHPHIKLRHHVTQVRPAGDSWEVTARDLVNGNTLVDIYDAVMVCNGHYHTPIYPQLAGAESFLGETLHSHDYREPSRFLGQRVVLVGAGPSGIDLSIEASKTAASVILSHRPGVVLKNLPEKVVLKPEIERVKGSQVFFKDGTSTEADVLFYCTGYRYSFPFLSPECGVEVEDNVVGPLYKHLFSIHRPTLAFIGLPYYVCAFSMFDLQARVFVKTLKGEVELPGREEMTRDTAAEAEERKKQGLKKNQFHMMGPLQGGYYEDLAKLGGLRGLPPVMTKLHNFASDRQLEELVRFRDDVFRILDDNNFIKVK